MLTADPIEPYITFDSWSTFLESAAMSVDCQTVVPRCLQGVPTKNSILTKLAVPPVGPAFYGRAYPRLGRHTATEFGFRDLPANSSADNRGGNEQADNNGEIRRRKQTEAYEQGDQPKNKHDQ